MPQEQMMMDPKKTPGLRPPPGVKPNLASRSSVYDVNLATAGLCLLLCTVLLCMQLFTKYFLMNGLKWEDCMSLRLGLLGWPLICPRYSNTRMGKVRFFFAIEAEHTDGARQLLLIPFVVLGMVTVVSYGASSHQWNITLDQVMHFASVRRRPTPY